uniref:Uncharacterized protein n=1 Tax=Arundo donax TaxID=35708 RepID=A0A0A9AQU3_ARUDO
MKNLIDKMEAAWVSKKENMSRIEYPSFSFSSFLVRYELH